MAEGWPAPMRFLQRLRSRATAGESPGERLHNAALALTPKASRLCFAFQPNVMTRMKRLRTNVEGLDTILNGGLFEGGVYIFEGPPGVGKTTLANQIAYTLARRETRTLYVTMLAESHARMLQHMEGQVFFDHQDVNAQVFYVSGYREFEQGGLKAVVGLLQGELIRHRAGLLVIDGLVVGGPISMSDDSVRQFVHELQSLVSALSCTCLILTSGNGNALSAEQTMVDGIFSFEDYGFHWRAERRIQVRKFRGSQIIRGRHTFCISSRGLQFFPRLESLPPPASSGTLGPGTLPFGLPALDSVLRAGGVLAGSASVLTGQSGSGKTTLALAFAAASTTQAPGLLLPCTELVGDLRRGGAELGLGVAHTMDSGALVVEPLGQEDESMDEMGHKVLRLVDEMKIRRLVVDGLAGLADTLAFSERGYRFLGRLLLELKARGVTSLFTVDPAALAAAADSPLAEGVVGWFDNVFAFDASPAPHGADRPPGRILSIIKIRGSQASQASVDVDLSLQDASVSPSA
ncbi:Circadian clock protein kinase KaiC [Variovorax paradoxus]|uniref:Circadian clock protein kinase KaiC n=2 Tax=Variovorax paradoxus TaxID=34073 RepID=A0A679JQR7_VARPD|nr:Circadian clock protein kinase KaiC [Variovorax paradoxus]